MSPRKPVVTASQHTLAAIIRLLRAWEPSDDATDEDGALASMLDDLDVYGFGFSLAGKPSVRAAELLSRTRTVLIHEPETLPAWCKPAPTARGRVSVFWTAPNKLDVIHRAIFDVCGSKVAFLDLVTFAFNRPPRHASTTALIHLPADVLTRAAEMARTKGARR